MVKEFGLKIVKWSLIVFVILNVLGVLLDFNIRRSNIFKVNVLFNIDLPDNIILGSSRSLTGINTNLLAQLTKKKWYNLSMDDTPVETHLLLYQLLIEQGKTPKQILLQYDRSDNLVDSTRFFDNDYQFLPYINKSESVSNYLKHKDNYLLFKYLPIYKYVYFNVELFYPSILLFVKPKYQHRFDEIGDYSYPKNYLLKDSTKNWESRNLVLKSSNISILHKLCKLNKTDMILYTAPIYRTVVYPDTQFSNYYNFSNLFNSNLNFSDDFHISTLTKDAFTKNLYSALYIN